MARNLSPSDVAEFRERLCRAAAHLFVERGPEAVTMRQLAAELGVSPMTPYRYFKDKEAILRALRVDGLNRFAAALEAALNAPGDALARSKSVGEAYIRFALENPDVYRLIFDIAPPDLGADPELAQAALRARSTMTDHVEGLIAEGVIAVDPHLFGHMIWTALHGAILLHLSGLLPAEYDVRRLDDEWLTALLRAFPGQRPAQG